MNLARILPRSVWGMAAAALLGVPALGISADLVPAPAPAGAVVMEGPEEGGCSTCSGGGAAGRPSLFHGRAHKLHTPYLCPGACFGYFQTKWNRWENVCSHYYLGVGASDAPKPPIPALTQPAGPQTATPPGSSPLPMPMPEPKNPLTPPSPSIPPTPTPPR